ncbi:MAG: RNA 2',3'-cyclic phosphodiesterase [Oscillospiraceae bacterium]
MRLFTALHFSNEISETLLQAIDRLKSQGVSANFTRPENLHLTLAFIGETNNVKAAIDAVEQTDDPPFIMTVGGYGRFGNLYWAGIYANPALERLALNMQERLRRAGFNIERRAWKPHITLARRLETDVPVKLDIPKMEMFVREVSLMRSDRPQGKLKYTEVYRKELLHE